MKQDINESLGIREKQPKETAIKKYIAIEAIIGVLKIAFWIVFGVFYLGLFVAAQDSQFISSSYFVIVGLIALVFFVTSYAVIQLLEVFVDVAKNTNQTNLLLRKQLEDN